MEFRPVNADLLITCASTERCNSCPLRIGCPIRRTFYEGDIKVEISLQRAEIRLSKFVGEEVAFRRSDRFRQKILCERGEHPDGYSYI